MSDQTQSGSPRYSVLPRLVAQWPPLASIVVGIALLLLGMLIVARPLTSLWLLGLYVGVSAIVSGMLDLVAARQNRRRWTRSLAILWIIGGLAILTWFGRSLELLPIAIGVLLVIGGLDALLRIRQGVVSVRVLRGAWGAAQLVLGVLSFAWPDVTVLVLAVVFGVRTIIFGGTLVVRGIRDITVGDRVLSSSARARRRRRVWAAMGRYVAAVLVLAIAAGSWGMSAWLRGGAPVIDAFYDPPAEVPALPGKLIRDSEYVGRIPDGASVRRILYTTTDARGLAAVASALVITPADMPRGLRPVIAWNHGTTGVARACAPSLSDSGATRWAVPDIEQAIERGWVVVASDYSGQGAPGVFPYLIGEGEARSTLDAVLAASELEDLRLRRDVVLWGHSQGGHAALWAAQIAPDYAPDLRIRGTAVMAPVTNPSALAGRLLSAPEDAESTALLSVLVSWVLVPYSDTYPDVHLTRYVAPGAERIVREMTQRCPSEPGALVSVLAALGVANDRPLYEGNLTAGPLGRRLAENAVEGPLGAPLLVAWGSDDEVIPTVLQEEFVLSMCEAGESTRWGVYAGVDHTGIMLPESRFLPRLMNWTDARFLATSQPVDDCSRLPLPGDVAR